MHVLWAGDFGWWAGDRDRRFGDRSFAHVGWVCRRCVSAALFDVAWDCRRALDRVGSAVRGLVGGPAGDVVGFVDGYFELTVAGFLLHVCLSFGLVVFSGLAVPVRSYAMRAVCWLVFRSAVFVPRSLSLVFKHQCNRR